MLNKLLSISFLLLFILGTTNFSLAQTGEERLHVFDDRKVPDDPNVMFYLHKNTNPNAIVYALKLGVDGKIDPKEPMEVFWRRYQEDGRKMKLRWLEKTFAFDFKVKAVASKPNTYEFSLIALKNKKLYVTQNKKGEPEVATTINGQIARLEKVYLTVDDSKTMQDVLAMELFGKDFKTGKLVYEKIINK